MSKIDRYYRPGLALGLASGLQRALEVQYMMLMGLKTPGGVMCYDMAIGGPRCEGNFLLGKR